MASTSARRRKFCVDLQIFIPGLDVVVQWYSQFQEPTTQGFLVWDQDYVCDCWVFIFTIFQMQVFKTK